MLFCISLLDAHKGLTLGLKVMSMVVRVNRRPLRPMSKTFFNASSLESNRACINGWQKLPDLDLRKPFSTSSANSNCCSMVRSLKLRTSSAYSMTDLILSTLQQATSARKLWGEPNLLQTRAASALV